MPELTWSGRALVATLLFRLLFGGYLAGMDQYGFNDAESALTVVLIYALLGVFATLFVSGKRYGVTGVIGVTVILVVMQSMFILLAFYDIADAGLHDPVENSSATLLRYLFTFLTLVFSIKVYKEMSEGRARSTYKSQEKATPSLSQKDVV